MVRRPTAVVVALATIATGCHAPRNDAMLMNASFEEGGGADGHNAGVALHWQNTDGKVHARWYEIDRDVARTGHASQRMTYLPGTSDPWGTVWQFTPIGSIEPGRTYEASVWCRVHGITGASASWGGLRLAVRWMNADNRILREDRAPLDRNDDQDWHRIAVTAVAPPEASRLQFLVYLHTEAGTLWYDDAAVRAVDAK